MYYCRREQADYLKEQDEQRKNMMEDRMYLEEVLNEERQKRMEAEMKAAAEIERLTREVEALKGARKDRVRA